MTLNIQKSLKTSFISLAILLLLWSLTTPNNFLPWLRAESQFSSTLGLLLLVIAHLKHKTTRTSNLFGIGLFFLIPSLVFIHQASTGKINAFFISIFLQFLLIYWCAAIGFFLGSTNTQQINKKLIPFLLLSAIVLLGTTSILQWINAKTWLDNHLPTLGSLILSTTSLERPISNLGQPNNFGTLLIWGAAALTFLQSSKNKGMSKLSAIFIVLIGFLIASTQSRTALLNLLILNILFIVLPFRRIWKKHFILLALSTVGFLLINPHLHSILCIGECEQIQTNVFSRGSSLRIPTWNFFLKDVFPKHPLGLGLDGITHAQFLHAESFPFVHDQLFTGAHNIIIDVIICFGIPGLALATIITIKWINRIKFDPKNEEMILHATILTCFFIHALLEIPHFHGFLLWIPSFSVGALFSIKSSENNYITPNKSTSFIATGAAILSLTYIYNYFDIQYSWTTSLNSESLITINMTKEKEYIYNQYITPLKILKNSKEVDADTIFEFAKRKPYYPYMKGSANILESRGRFLEAKILREKCQKIHPKELCY